jgi:hypothetical protein
MRGLALRIYRVTGSVGLIAMTLGGLSAVLLLAGRNDSILDGLLVLALPPTIIAMTASIVVATKYHRASAVVDYDKVLLSLLYSNEEYCVVLRPFGHDGEIIVPADRTRARLRGYNKTVTMEQVAALAVRSTLNLETYGFVDQGVRLAPPGLTFMRVPHDEWRFVAVGIIRRAHSIVLLLPPGRDMGAGFMWEIEQIVKYGLQSRVIVVLPPYDQDVRAHQEAIRQTGVVMTLLEGSGMSSEISGDHGDVRLEPTTLAVKCGPRKDVERTR